MRLVLLLFMPFCISSVFAEGGILYIYDGTELLYDESLDSYILKIGERSHVYPRHRKNALIRDHLRNIDEDDQVQFETTIRNHALAQMLATPSDEEILEASIKMQENALALMNTEVKDCEGIRIPLTTNVQLQYSTSPEVESINDKLLERITLQERGFFSLGEIEGFSIELNTFNDNHLNGAFTALGLTEYNEGIEGDDRGKTFGEVLQARLDFEKGSISFRQYSDLYGRLAPQIKFNGNGFPTTLNYDEERKVYSESLVVEGYEFEVVRKFEGGTYVKLIGRSKTINDTEGIALGLQENWHESTDSVLYNYVDHMKKQTGYEGYLELGNQFELYSSENTRITSTISGGQNLSSLGREHTFTQARGEVQVDFMGQTDSGARFPSWQTKIFVQGRRYADHEDATLKGLEVTKRFSLDNNAKQIIYLRGSVMQEDDPLSREFGQAEIDNRGRLDYQSSFGIGYEYKF